MQLRKLNRSGTKRLKGLPRPGTKLINPGQLEAMRYAIRRIQISSSPVGPISPDGMVTECGGRVKVEGLDSSECPLAH